MKLVVVVENQEEGIEFFIRRIMAELRRRVFRTDVVLVDTGSCDDTPRILRRMSGMFGFEFLEMNKEENNYFLGFLSRQPVFYYDVRGMSGLELARAPLFQHLLTPVKR